MQFFSNKILFNIHGWLGLNLGLLLFVICFSGTFAVFSSEADWLANPDMRVTPQDKPIQWGRMYQQLTQTFPDGHILSLYKQTYSGTGPWFASGAYVRLSNGQTRKVYLNPYAGEIQGHTSFFNTQRFFRSFHRRFFDGERGIVIVTFFSFFLLFSVMTGFLFYKGWLKNLFKLRLTKGLKTLWSDLHKIAGIWSLLFALLIALTGIFYFVEVVVQAAGKYDAMLPDAPPKLSHKELQAYGPNPRLLPVDTYINNAQAAFPKLDIQSLRLPDTPYEYVYIDGQADNPITRDRANKVYLHPFTGQVVHIQRSTDLNTAEFITDIADPLHFGYFGGLTTKILWFIFGLGISVSILSGTYLWFIRKMKKMERMFDRRSEQNGTARQHPTPQKGFSSMIKHISTVPLLRGALISTFFTIGYLFHTVCVTVDGIYAYGPTTEPVTAVVDTVTTGPWKIELSCVAPCGPQRTRFEAQFLHKGIPNFKKASLVTPTGGDSIITDLSRIFDKSASWFSAEPVATTNARMHIQIISHSDKIFKSDDIQKASLFRAGHMLNSAPLAAEQPSFPETRFTMWIYIFLFVASTILIIGCWVYALIKACLFQLKLNKLTVRSAHSNLNASVPMR